LTLIEDLPPKLANYIGLKNHSGSLDNNEFMAEAIPYIFNQESMADQKHVITTDTPTQQQVVKHNIISQAQAVASTLIQDLRHLPKKKIISAATHQHEDAAYLYRWQQYIESIASETYPQQAIENNITGQLRLLVALKPDGSVHDVTIRQSSGQEILDNAALNIVQKAQPFEPIPPDMLQNNEIIEIIRTWDFRGTLRVAS
jgi:protein TonB